MFRCALTAAVLTMATSAEAAIGSSETARLAAAAQVVQDIRDTIPPDSWSSARCVAVIPDLKKAAFIVGGEYGKGVVSCRSGDRWSAPAFMQLAKGRWGFQAGAEQMDIVLLVMNEQGVQRLLDQEVTLGADLSIAAGPVGRQGYVGTDAVPTAEIICYSRAQRLFAGIDLSGSVLRPDDGANVAAYGKGASARTILGSREISAPVPASAFLTALNARTTVAAAPASSAADSPPLPPQTKARRTAEDDLRTRVVDILQSLDRILADTTPAAVGTSGTRGSANNGTVSVERERLLQLRRQLDELVAALNKR